jgi:hypothetical protein
MADYTDTKVSQLVINNLTQEKFEELKAKGELQDDQIYCTPDSGNGFDLFDSKWADHILNDPSWLRADNFSWHSGDVYVAAYEHLLGDLGPETDTVYYCWGPAKGNYVYTKSATPSVGDMMYFNENGTMVETSGQISAGNVTNTDGTSISNDNGYTYPRYSAGDITISGREKHYETIGNTTITFYQAEDGHKVCTADQEANIQAVFESTGVAWYYIIDTANKQFKLPRTRWGFTGLRDSVGNYIAEGLPNIAGNFNAYTYGSGGGSKAVTSAISTSNTLAGGSQSSYNFNNFSIDASRSSAVYGASNTVQPRATQMYLYFYVGDWIKGKEIIDIGAITEELPKKANVDLLNVTDSGKLLFIHNSAVSGTYEDLPVGAHGTYYTMPEDGWLVIISTNSQTANSSIGLRNASNEITNQTFISNTNAVYGAAIPVTKGQQVQGYYYGQDISTLTIRFVYLVGNKNKKA